DERIDHVSLAEYFDGNNGARLKMAPIARAAFGEAYAAEYGLELDQQSCLNFLFFAKADRRARFLPFGVFSDERYHLVDGNDAIATGLRDSLAPAQLEYGMRLVRVRRRADGAYEWTFENGGTTLTRVHDVVVIAIPFSVLRGVELDASLALPGFKRIAIDELGYGTNAKQMVGFRGRPWAELGSVGVSYSDLQNHQNTWETNPSRATAQQAILTDYASGQRGAALNPRATQRETARFLADLERVWPGAAGRALTDAAGKYIAHLEHWPSNPLTLGSYTCYRPGQFTRIAGNEAKPVGNLFFAGEHTNSFYDSQGFMEGACLSGLAAAAAILAQKNGV
ncbi:MAG TPA: FAD-dependent oxidoreductase, partial [Burkholderiaceae bacterium]|nr:FAD-dependent oxidoreductase [Burkholderiaceae bacterium]